MTINSNLTLEIYEGYALDEFDRWDAIIHPDVQAQSKGITANAKKEFSEASVRSAARNCARSGSGPHRSRIERRRGGSRWRCYGLCVG